MYPLVMSPHFRHGAQTPWGGTMLRDLFLKDAPEGITGESLEVSALPNMQSVVSNGAHAGKTLDAMVRLWGADLTGDIGGAFPLLIKLLDARELLSVQVHPDDAYAQANEGKRGKSEAWVVLNCEPGARIAYGVNAGRRGLREIMDAGEIEDALNWVDVRPGDVFYIPAGTVHALGGGIQCYEVQQSSDVTYRLWDWGRVGADGKPRDLHIEQAIAVSRMGEILPKCGGATVLCKGGSRTYFIADAHFELSRLNISGDMPLEPGRMRMITALGASRIRWAGGEIELAPFTTVLIPAALEDVVISGELKALQSAPSDRARLREELGYRAADVAGLL
ncbi:MAG: type I phosphomannose isomerase catalytic subunit [Christensenellales bacterium]|jgi:mannose-6-phosphate isomerase